MIVFLLNGEYQLNLAHIFKIIVFEQSSSSSVKFTLNSFVYLLDFF